MKKLHFGTLSTEVNGPGGFVIFICSFFTLAARFSQGASFNTSFLALQIPTSMNAPWVYFALFAKVASNSNSQQPASGISTGLTDAAASAMQTSSISRCVSAKSAAIAGCCGLCSFKS